MYLNTFLKISISFTIFFLSLVVPAVVQAQYRVSGVVDFSYRNYDTKINGINSSQSAFEQAYTVNLSTPIFDPRLLLFNGGVGYHVITASGGPDNKLLNYNAAASFFPSMMVSFDLFANRMKSTISGNTVSIPYDVISDSYGGVVNLHLSKLISKNNKGNNNNNYNNNNSNSGRGRIVLPVPDITLAYNHSELESHSSLNPQRETRETGSIGVVFNQYRLVKLRLEARDEKFEDVLGNRSYETKTKHASSDIIVSPNADLFLDATFQDRTTSNFNFFATHEETARYRADLRFKEKDGFRHYYRYSNSSARTDTFDYDDLTWDANFVKKVTESISVSAGINYRNAEYDDKSGSVPSRGGVLNTVGLLGGVSYYTMYTPSFLGPFSFTTRYDLSSGSSRFESQTPGLSNGGGWYYKNGVELGLASNGWETENLNLSLRYSSQRDDSPLRNNVLDQGIVLSAVSRRFARTVIRGNMNYAMFNGTNLAGSIFLNVPSEGLNQDNIIGVTQKRRTVLFDAAAEHYFTREVTGTVGASRGRSATNTYTLSTLTIPTTTYESKDFIAYASLAHAHFWTRSLFSKVEFREEYRTYYNADTQSHILDANLKYRFRRIITGLDYRYRQDEQNGGRKNQQQYFFANLSRPF